MPLSEAACQDRNSVLRATAGALFGAIPLLYTMEMWWYGRAITHRQILLWLVPAVLVVVCCLLFGGFRRGRVERLRLDVPITFGIAAVVAALTLVIVGQIELGHTPLSAAVRIVAVETIPCAIGAALALTLFRPRKRDDEDVDRRLERQPQDVQKLLATIVGAVFFAFNVAPTEEPLKMTMEAEPWHFPLIMLFTFAITYMIVFLADFSERPPHYREGVLGHPVTETLVCYLISLVVSGFFLLAFGHVTGTTPPYYVLTLMVMLGYVTSLGGAAGRVLVVG